MKDILIEVFECGCCRFAEPVVRSAVARVAERVECKLYTLPKDRAVFEAHNIVPGADNTSQAPVVIINDRFGEQIRVDKINQRSVQDALERLLGKSR